MDTLVKYLQDGATAKDGILRTEIMAGYDLYKDERGISYLGEEVIRRQHNKIVVGGTLEFLAKMFGVNSALTIKDLNTIMGIGTTGTVNSSSTYNACLFNIGLGGCGNSFTDVKTTLDQENIVPNMIPFRIVDSAADLNDTKKAYWFKKKLDNGKLGYYLKTFDSTPTVHSLWKDGASVEEDGTEVVGNPADSDRVEGIESFVEVILRVSATDLREYFQLYDDPNHARFSSIGLCMGQMGTLSDGTSEYKNVRQFSILNFSNEMLHFNKDLSIIYRIYIS